MEPDTNYNDLYWELAYIETPLITQKAKVYGNDPDNWDMDRLILVQQLICLRRIEDRLKQILDKLT